MTTTLPAIGSIIQVSVGGSVPNRWGGIDDWETSVDIAVTAEMHDSWEKWRTEYRTFEDMVASIHHDEVYEAMRGME